MGIGFYQLKSIQMKNGKKLLINSYMLIQNSLPTKSWLQKLYRKCYQIKDMKRYLEKVNNKERNEIKLLTNAPQNIVDQVLSENLNEFDVIDNNTIVLYPQKITDPEITANVLRKYIPGMDGVSSSYLTGENRYEVIAENVPPEIANKIREAQLTGVGFDDDKMGTININNTLFYVLDAKQTNGDSSDSYQLSKDEFWKVKGSFKRLE